MDLHSSENFWPIKNGLIQDFPSLQSSLQTDIAIIGAGISGALVADILCKDGHDVIMVDKRHSGNGSTAASTALIQYEIDTPLVDLIKIVGNYNALRSYELCLKSIEDLHKITVAYPNQSDFKKKPSFQFTSFKSHLKKHFEEFELRRKHKISNVDWLSPDDIRKLYGFQKPGGILSAHGAEVDPFKLSHNLISPHWKKNLRVFDNTKIVEIVHKKNGVVLKTDTMQAIKANKLVIACGYESQNYLPKKIEIQKTTYAVVSEVLEEKDLWHKNSLIWETTNPYLYLRQTADNRILVGGKDDEFYNPTQRDINLPKKAQALEKGFKKLFPELPFRVDYKWGGTFCGTKDGLPYIGSIPERPHTYFALGFGGNGITFSVIAAQIIRDLVNNKKNDDAKIFSFER